MERIRHERTTERTTFYLGFSNTVQKNVALSKLNDLIQMQDIKIVFKAGDVTDLLHGLLTGEIDLLLSDGIVPEVKNVCVKEISKSEMVLAYPKNDAQAF